MTIHRPLLFAFALATHSLPISLCNMRAFAQAIPVNELAISDRKDIKTAGAIVGEWMSFSPSGEWLGVRYPLSKDSDRIHVWNCNTWDSYHWDVQCKPDKLRVASTCAFDHKRPVLYFNSQRRVVAQSLPPGLETVVDTLPDDRADSYQSVFEKSDGSVLLTIGTNRPDGIDVKAVSKSGARIPGMATPIRLAESRRIRLLTSTAVNTDCSKLAIGLERSITDKDDSNPEYPLEIWSTKDGKRLFSQAGHGHWINCIAFSSDGHLIGSGSADGEVIIWDVESGRKLRSLKETGSISAIAFDGSGALIAFTSFASRGRDNLFIAQLKTGELLGSLPADGRAAALVAFSPDGKRVATFGAEGIVRIWRIESIKTRK
jgi:WD40 repeat protein